MIDTILYNGRAFNFHNGNVRAGDNIFTAIVGRNGSGKSRLLRSLVTRCILNYAGDSEVDSKDRYDLPTTLIAVSTSPFDRFPASIPLAKNKDSQLVDLGFGYYHYQGLRGLHGLNLGVSFMGRVMAGLLRSLTTDPGRIKTILNVLSYLGFSPELKAEFSCEVTNGVLRDIVESEDPIQTMQEHMDGSRRSGVELRRVIARLSEASDDEKLRFVDSIKYFLELRSSVVSTKYLYISISERGIVEQETGWTLDERFVPAMEAGLVRLRGLELHKENISKPFKISDASSGEQCVVLSLLGIASRIEDGALICIDEPENCLHPEWQERYISLMMSTFSNFKSCQFIIATHSPQVVSKLEGDNCFILDLHKHVLLEAAGYSRRSADFQLANVFEAPGFKNEYLMRELLGILTKLSCGESLDETDFHVMYTLGKLSKSMEDSDPVSQLYSLALAATGASSNGR